MATIKNYTDIEQSRKLVEILPLESSDGYWDFQIDGYNLIADELGYYKNDSEIPCWSLGALIELLPKTIETKKPKNLYFSEILPANNCVAYTAFNENKEMVFLKYFATGVESNATLIDNMVSMICWLLENNYIRKEK